MKAIFYIPTLFFDLLRVWTLPRQLFVATYSPRGEQVRQAEQQVRNATRLIDYRIKRAMVPVDEV